MKKIRFDGAAKPNPGEMGIGVVLLDGDKVIDEISEKLPGKGTSNIAEYMAILTGITKALEMGWKDVAIEGDSKLVVNQVKRSWNVNDEKLKLLFAQVMDKMTGFDSYRIRWIPREENAKADELASGGLGYKEDSYPKGDRRLKRRNEKSGTKCPECSKEYKFKWQKFKDGSTHIRRECPTHGFKGYAPKEKPFVILADENKKKAGQAKLF